MEAGTHAFFLPPFLPLDMRLFLPTAMTAGLVRARRLARSRKGVPGGLCSAFANANASANLHSPENPKPYNPKLAKP